MELVNKLKQGFDKLDTEVEQLKIDEKFDFGYKGILEYLPKIYNKVDNIERELEELKKKKNKTEDDIKKLESIADLVDKIISIGAEEIKKPEEKELTYDIYFSLREQGNTHKDIVKMAKEEYGIKKAHHKLFPFSAIYKRWGKGLKDETKLEPVEEKKEFTYEVLESLIKKDKDFDEIKKIAKEEYGFTNINVLRAMKGGYTRVEKAKLGKEKIPVEEKKEEIKRIKKKKIKKQFDIKEFYNQKGVKLTETKELLFDFIYNRMRNNEKLDLESLADDLNKIDPIKYKKETIHGEKKKYCYTEPNSTIFHTLHYLTKKGIVTKEGSRGDYNYFLKDIKKIKEGDFDKNDYISLVYFNGVDSNILKYIFKDFDNKSLKKIAIGASHKFRKLQKQAKIEKKAVAVTIGERTMYLAMDGEAHPTLESAIEVNQGYIKEQIK